MSTSDNVTRLAKRISQLTEFTYSKSLNLAKQVNVFIKEPLSDAAGGAQPRLEALVAHTLANAFQDCQVNGALLGILRVQPTPRGVVLQLEPEMSDEVIAALLPRLDFGYRGLRCVPGVRPHCSRGAVVLRSLFGSAEIALSRNDGSP
ncbi:hypothetical protein [Actinacidiphila reveromycinica]|uniref:hypothetical protein n=1 Tax=Actinacidiphila reveromycinica TaxID=659352 RepID=UPI001F1705BE|nr:hypothetical protein [Streptomyces sp. SN-593]